MRHGYCLERKGTTKDLPRRLLGLLKMLGSLYISVPEGIGSISILLTFSNMGKANNAIELSAISRGLVSTIRVLKDV